MVIIPAIDILQGCCVRLSQGEYSQVERYNQLDPLEVASQFEALGVKRIHVVDLDAAKGDGNTNRQLIRNLRNRVTCVLQVGGGIRTEKDLEELLDIGIDRLILGTALVKDPDKVAKWIARYGKRFIAGIDAREGKVKVAGWQEGTDKTDIEVAKLAFQLGANAIIYTNISRDGMLQGPDLARTLEIAQASKLPVILSGGVSCIEDLEEAYKVSSKGIVGVILGKALYTGKLDLKEILAKYPYSPFLEW